MAEAESSPSSVTPLAAWPLTERMISPACMPAAWAAPPSFTWLITARPTTPFTSSPKTKNSAVAASSASTKFITGPIRMVSSRFQTA